MSNVFTTDDDSADQTAFELESVSKRVSRKKAPNLTFVSTAEAMRGEAVYEVESQRDVTRILFISRDISLLNPTTQSLDGYLQLSDLFDEVHILILRSGIVAKHPVLRVAHNVFLYTASALNWWWMPVAAMRLAHRQLVFAEGFRPDLIVARDPFECAVVGSLLARRHGRAAQLHILEDYTTPEFLQQDSPNKWRQYLPRFLIPRFQSVRVSTTDLLRQIEMRFRITDIKILPRFTNYESIIALPPTLDLNQKYPQYAFIVLYVGILSHESTLFRAIDAVRFILRNPRVAMIVVGDGPARKEGETRAQILGIAKQIIFIKTVEDVVPYLKSAQLLLVTDTDAFSEDLVLKGAAAGIPMVIAATPTRTDLFPDDLSALLFPADDVQKITDHLNTLLNNAGLRRQFTLAAQHMIQTRFHQDIDSYRQEYRASIEQALFVADSNPTSE